VVAVMKKLVLEVVGYTPDIVVLQKTMVSQVRG
jgi:hypothetical protein